MQNQSQVAAGVRFDKPRQSRVDDRKTAEARSLRMPHIQHLRKMLDELEIKLDAQMCLEVNGRHRYARRIPVEQNVDQILQSLQDLVDSYLRKSDSEIAASIGDHGSNSKSGRHSDGSAIRIQLKLSPALVRVLQTVRQEHVKASELVESVLWSSARVQDTARLAGIHRPRQSPAA